MSDSNSGRRPGLPSFLERHSTDEYSPLPYTDRDKAAVQDTSERGAEHAERLNMWEPNYFASRLGTAAGLRAINAQMNETFFDVPAEAEIDAEAAEATLGGKSVIDVQVHYVTEAVRPRMMPGTYEIYQQLKPEWWDGMSDMIKYDVAEFLRCVFLDTDNAVAILTSAPFVDTFLVTNEEMAALRSICERAGESGRLLNHTVIEPTEPNQLERMDEWAAKLGTVAWKVYTYGRHAPDGSGFTGGWMLDDQENGIPFLERVRETGVKRVCAHKGLSGLVDTGSPVDFGPAAAAFPDIDFIAYHSGYEFPSSNLPEEGPYTQETAGVGVNRLLASMEKAGVAPNSNIYAELGTTWFTLIRRPDDAAHVMGKLLQGVGENNILWGTDSIWYGSPQPAIDAFRAFEIPESFQEKYGYPALTKEIKEKILAENAARVYEIDLEKARANALTDDLAWVRTATEEYRASGIPIS